MIFFRNVKSFFSTVEGAGCALLIFVIFVGIMATVYPPATLCIFPRQMRFREKVVTGISVGKNADHVLVTGHQNTVSIYKVEDRQPVKCWTTRQNYTFKTAAVYDQFHKVYIIVVNNQIIRTWTEDDSQLEIGNKIMAPFPIHEIITSEYTEPLVLYDTGHIQFLHSVSEKQLEQTTNHQDMLSTNDHHEIINVSETVSRRSDRPLLVTISKNNETGEISFNSYLLYADIRTYAHNRHECTQRTETFACSAFYKSDRGLFALILESNGLLHRYNFNCLEHTVTVGYDTVMSLNMTVPPSTCMQILTEAHVTLVYASKKSPTNTFNVMSFDVKYKLQHSASTFDSNSTAKLVQLKRIGKMLYALTDKDIMSIPFEARESTLSDVLGTGTLDDVNVSQTTARNAVEWSHGQVKYIPRPETRDSRHSKELLKHTQKYEEEGLSEFQVCVKTLQEVQSTGNINLMLEMLSFFKNIPEFALVNCLQCYLGKLLDEGASAEHCKQKLPFIDEIVSKCVDTVFLVENLRKLPFGEVEFLLQYLQQLLNDHSDLVESAKPTAIQLVEWICALLDAHFQSLTLSVDPAIHKILSNLSTIVHEKCNFLASLSSLEELLVVMQKWHHIPARKVQAYSIDTMYLN